MRKAIKKSHESKKSIPNIYMIPGKRGTILNRIFLLPQRMMTAIRIAGIRINIDDNNELFFSLVIGY
jgi:hypothetical protein